MKNIILTLFFKTARQTIFLTEVQVISNNYVIFRSEKIIVTIYYYYYFDFLLPLEPMKNCNNYDSCYYISLNLPVAKFYKEKLMRNLILKINLKYFGCVCQVGMRLIMSRGVINERIGKRLGTPHASR